jgi:hypothetical protein
MALNEDISREFEEIVEQTNSATIALAAIGVEMQAVLNGDRHAPGLSATVLAAQAKRASLALSSLSALVEQMDLLVRLGAS